MSTEDKILVIVVIITICGVLLFSVAKSILELLAYASISF